MQATSGSTSATPVAHHAPLDFTPTKGDARISPPGRHKERWQEVEDLECRLLSCTHTNPFQPFTDPHSSHSGFSHTQSPFDAHPSSNGSSPPSTHFGPASIPPSNPHPNPSNDQYGQFSNRLHSEATHSRPTLPAHPQMATAVSPTAPSSTTGRQSRASHGQEEPTPSSEATLQPGRNVLTFTVTPLKRGLYTLKHLSAQLDHLQLHVPLRPPAAAGLSRGSPDQDEEDADLLTPQVRIAPIIVTLIPRVERVGRGGARGRMWSH